MLKRINKLLSGLSKHYIYVLCVLSESYLLY